MSNQTQHKQIHQCNCNVVKNLQSQATKSGLVAGIRIITGIQPRKMICKISSLATARQCPIRHNTNKIHQCNCNVVKNLQSQATKSGLVAGIRIITDIQPRKMICKISSLATARQCPIRFNEYISIGSIFMRVDAPALSAESRKPETISTNL